MSSMLQLFLSAALPVVIGMLFAAWSTNKHLDALSAIDRIDKLLDAWLPKHSSRIGIFPIRHRPVDLMGV